jgi:CheY-like chemotaxis protein
MNSSKHTIAFIDDEKTYAMRYVRELVAKFDTHYFDSASQGLKFCQDHPTLSAIVLDVMMPPPAEVDMEDVKDGLETGIWVLGKLRSHIIDKSIGVIILSNRNIDLIREAVAAVGIPVENINTLVKIDTPSWTLPIRVQTLIDNIRG